MKLLYIDQPLNNRGDESAHRGLMNKLIKEYNDIEIRVLFVGRKQKDIDEFIVKSEKITYTNIPISQTYKCFFNAFIKRFMRYNLPHLLYLIPKMHKVIKYFREADCVIFAPGGMNLGGFQDWTHQGYLTLAMFEHKKIVYYGRSIGPFSDSDSKSRLFKKNSIKLLNYFSYTSLRDLKSQTMAEELGIPFVATIDSAFLVDPVAKVPSSFVTEIENSEYVVFVPNSLAWHSSFKSFTFEEMKAFWIVLANRLAEEYPHYKIAMLPQTIGFSKYLPDGYKLFTEIKNASLYSDRFVVLDEQYGSDIQQIIISKAKFLVGARYHSVIFAINQGTPFVSLSYEHKMNGVIEMLNLQRYEVDLATLMKGLSIDKILNSNIIDLIISKTHSAESCMQAKIKARKIADTGFEQLRLVLHP